MPRAVFSDSRPGPDDRVARGRNSQVPGCGNGRPPSQSGRGKRKQPRPFSGVYREPRYATRAGMRGDGPRGPALPRSSRYPAPARAAQYGKKEVTQPMSFSCSICGEESIRICARCTKDTCSNHLCDKCLRCSDCCECEVVLTEPVREPARSVFHPAPRPGPTPEHEPEPPLPPPDPDPLPPEEPDQGPVMA